MEQVRLTLEEWNAKGEAIFGPDRSKWEFVCPACGYVQKGPDFKPYEDMGATPNSAAFECIGRYNGSGLKAFTEPQGSPCDYVAYGLFRICPFVVELEDGHEIYCFAFNDPTAKPAETTTAAAELVPCAVPGAEGAR